MVTHLKRGMRSLLSYLMENFFLIEKKICRNEILFYL
jgi:hypothetical protein